MRMLSNFFAILRAPLTPELTLSTTVLCLSGLRSKIAAVKIICEIQRGPKEPSHYAVRNPKGLVYGLVFYNQDIWFGLTTVLFRVGPSSHKQSFCSEPWTEHPEAGRLVN